MMILCEFITTKGLVLIIFKFHGGGVIINIVNCFSPVLLSYEMMLHPKYLLSITEYYS